MNLKFNVKDIDWKQFFLHRGEWIGVGIALAIFLPVFFIGAKKAVFSGSADANAKEVAGLTQNAQTKIKNSKPDKGIELPPPESNVQISFTAADPDQFQTDPWFVPSSIEDTKRRRPEVLSPDDYWQVAPVRGGIKIHIVEGKNIAVIRVKQRAENPKEKERREKLLRRIRRAQELRASMGGGFQGMPGMAGMMGGGMGGGMGGKGGGGGGQAGGPPGAGGMMMPGGGFGGGQLPGAQGQQARNMVKSFELMNIDKVKDDSSVQFAEELRPARIVVVTGSFPYKKQLEAFKVALRMRSLNDLVANLKDDVQWKFLGFDIQRRVLFADGREKSTWEEHYDKNMLEGLTRVLAYAVVPEDEDRELKDLHDLNAGLVNPGLVWARPPLDPELGSKYPDLETPRVTESKEKLKNLFADKNAKVPSQLQVQLEGKNINPLDPFAPVGGIEVKDQTSEAAAKPGEGVKKLGNEDDELPVPEYALVRFFDVTVEPGFTYEYRVRVKMANPNFNQHKLVAYPSLAKDKEIVGDWVTVPRVSVPYDVYWYVLDDKPDREKVAIQIHRWIDALTVNRSQVAVADWSILEKTPAYRGEYLGRSAMRKVPTWDTLEDKYDLTRDPQTKQKTTLPVDFTVRVPTKQFPAMLIDYQGGKDTQFRFGNKMIKEETPVETLVLSPEGRLEVRSSIDDANDERTGRVDAWKKRLDDVERSRRRGPAQALFDRTAMPGRPGGR